SGTKLRKLASGFTTVSDRGRPAMLALTGRAKSIIGMAHLKPLPGSPLYDPGGGMQAIIDGAARDLEALQAGGVDAIMFGNEGDRPYLLKATPESLAAMAAVVA